MTSPVLNEAARVLRLALAGTPADQALRETLTRTRHRSAPAERRAVSRAVFTYFRWLQWLPPKDSLQKQLAAALDLQARFDRNPAAIKPEALAARAVPEWLWNELEFPVGPAADQSATASCKTAWLRQLQREPILWIRAKQGQETKVAAALGHCLPADHSASRNLQSAMSYAGSKDLYQTDQFQQGAFEIQDLASQLVGHACAPQPGETWWDACAGEGGKTLHLADLMQGKGLIWATDRSVRRLARLKERTARAKIFNYRAAEWDGSTRLPTRTKFDGILVDAPCSGLGTWQRNPHARWTTQPTDVRELAAVQAGLLDSVAGSLKPGGRLVYSVCTLTRAETTAVADAFTAAHPDFQPIPAFPAVATISPGAEPPSPTFTAAEEPASPSSFIHHPSSLASMLWPHELDANGMFIAAWRRR